MVSFPNCKINLGLSITRKREDGYHNLETVFYPIQLKDILEIIPATNADTEKIIFSSTGLPIEGDEQNNLCIKAYHLLKADFPKIDSIQMHLHKLIPMGAGLGGGSADGAFALALLNKIFRLELTEQALIEYALQLGSDCPFFIINQPCIAKGRGEILERISLDLSDYQFLLVSPGIHINTGWAFSKIQPAEKAIGLNEILSLPMTEWKNLLVNDFEKPVFENYPEIAAIKTDLYYEGAIYSALSGSGSTVFGIFKKGKNLQSRFPTHYNTKLVD
jgi:4-diphosphocytidyl-2-C-methyl-D-erythritol kinase